MTLYKAMSAVKRRELEAEIERLRAEVERLRAENAELRERCKAIASDADNWKRLACTSDKDLNRPVEMDAAEREHYERGKDITGCDV